MEKGAGHKGSSVVRHSFVVRHAFVVRIWREDDQAEWRGWVQHAPTGESTYVQDVTALLDFIEQRAGKLATQSTRQGKSGVGQ